ncbi:MAG TPA: hypothetical protein VH120_09085 [Gemmataceae bacterium]|jgi:hypothetical protein|nr:hypothetical protein [Gemmataceae bacterium]
MIPLGGKDFPASPAELAHALRAALREAVRLPNERAAVSVDENCLRIDLGGGVLIVRGQPDDPAGVGQTQPGPSFQSLEVLAHPLNAEGAKLDFDLTAANVRFNYDRSRTGRPVLSLAAAGDGRVTARVSRAELEALVTAKAREAARQKGIDVEGIDFNLAQLGPRSVRLEGKAAVATKALFKTVRGAVVFGGRVDIDDRLVAKLSELNVAGEGMMIALAVNLIRGRITAFEGKEFPLTTFALGGVRLRDVQLQVGDELAVTAAFGS